MPLTCLYKQFKSNEALMRTKYAHTCTTHRHTQRHTPTQTDTGKQRRIQTDTHAHTHTCTHSCTHAYIQAGTKMRMYMHIQKHTHYTIDRSCHERVLPTCAICKLHPPVLAQQMC